MNRDFGTMMNVASRLLLILIYFLRRFAGSECPAQAQYGRYEARNTKTARRYFRMRKLRLYGRKRRRYMPAALY